MRKLKLLLSACLLTTAIPVSALASVNLDPGHDGVHIDDIVKAIHSGSSDLDLNRDNVIDAADFQMLMTQMQPEQLEQVQQFGTLYGTVVDDNGSPVAGATVALSDRVQTMTDSAGAFTLEDVPVTLNGVLQIGKDGFNSVSSPLFTVFAGQSVRFDTLRIPSFGSVTGTVYTEEMAPVYGAIATIQAGTQTITGMSDAAGRYILTNVPAGEHTISVQSAVYGTGSTSVTVKANAMAAAATVRLIKPASSTATLIGYVNSDVGLPIAEAQVTVTGTTYSAFTDASGFFILEHVPTGAIGLTVQAAGYETRSLTGITLTSSGYNFGTLQLQPIPAATGSLPVHVGDGALHLEGAYVSLMNGDLHFSVITDAAGIARFEGIPPGTYTLRAERSGYAPLVTTVIVVPGVNELVQAPLVKNAGSVTGAVYDPLGAPLAGISVKLYAENGTPFIAITDEAGRYLFSYVPFSAADYTLAVESPLYMTATVGSVRVTSGDPVVIPDQRLAYKTGKISGYATTDLSAALEGATVQLLNENHSVIATTTTDASGYYELTNIPPLATYTVHIGMTGYLPAHPRTVTIQPDAAELIDFTLAQGIAVSTADELLAALADSSVATIFLNNDITLAEPLILQRSVTLSGGFDGTTVLRAPYFDFADSSLELRMEGLQLTAVPGTSEETLRLAMATLASNIELSGIGGINGTLERIQEVSFPYRSYFAATDPSGPATAFVHNQDGLTYALEHEDVSTVYLADDLLMYDSYLSIPDRPIRFTSDTPKLLRVKGYSNRTGLAFDNVTLSDTLGPLLNDVSTGIVLWAEASIQATLDEDAVLYLVPDGTPMDAASILGAQLASTSALAQTALSIATDGLPRGDYVLYAIDSAGNVSPASDVIELRKSAGRALSDLNSELGITGTALSNVSIYDLQSLGITGLDVEEIGLYRYALSKDRVRLLGFGATGELTAAVQELVQTANDAPELHLALLPLSGGQEAAWNGVTAETMNGLGIASVTNEVTLRLAQHLLEAAFKTGGYKLLPLSEIRALTSDLTPFAALSGWNGSPLQLDEGTRRVQLRFAVKNAAGVSLKGLQASDISLQVDGSPLSLADVSFSELTYDDAAQLYSVIFTGEADAVSYVLSELSVNGTAIQTAESPLTVTTPNIAIPITSISLGKFGGGASSYVTLGSYLLGLNIAPYNATNTDLTWTVTPSDNAYIDGGGSNYYLNTRQYGDVTVTATNERFGVTGSAVFHIVDMNAAYARIKQYLSTDGSSPLTLQDIKETTIDWIVDDNFDIYKLVLDEKKAEFLAAESADLMNLMQSIPINYNNSAKLNRALLGDWSSVTATDLMNWGFYYASSSNVAYAKQIIQEQFTTARNGKLFTSSDISALNTSLLAKLPDVTLSGITGKSYNWDLSATVTFKMFNKNNEPIRGLTAPEVSTTILNIPYLLSDSSRFTDFEETSSGYYKFRIPAGVIGSLLNLQNLKLRIGTIDVPAYLTNYEIPGQTS
ncbi:carboxypeptidase regulatory-like domain-containing protein [Paenibacillus chartarius]|uniref:Carboxypeptidase regulatory-like domain-containing protein n=1 Tax=Paenibacillus chartarius TaxID=747481 RepID=A0ABV6DS74_9BACL